MLEATLEKMLADATAVDGGAELERARAVFHERTGEFGPADPCYEERIRCFFDWFLCDHRAADGRSPAERWLEQERRPDEARVARALIGGARSLYQVREAGVVTDRLGGGRFRVTDPRVREGDFFDGRLLVLDDELRFAPGIVFHPPETHEPLDELLVEIGAPDELDRPEVLDGLLRMRMRLERFTSIRPRHIYRARALADREILSAGWARKNVESGGLDGRS